MQWISDKDIGLKEQREKVILFSDHEAPSTPSWKPPVGAQHWTAGSMVIAFYFFFWNLTVDTEQKLRNLNFHDGAETTTILTDAGRVLIASH